MSQKIVSLADKIISQKRQPDESVEKSILLGLLVYISERVTTAEHVEWYRVALDIINDDKVVSQSVSAAASQLFALLIVADDTLDQENLESLRASPNWISDNWFTQQEIDFYRSRPELPMRTLLQDWDSLRELYSSGSYPGDKVAVRLNALLVVIAEHTELKGSTLAGMSPYICDSEELTEGIFYNDPLGHYKNHRKFADAFVSLAVRQAG